MLCSRRRTYRMIAVILLLAGLREASCEGLGITFQALISDDGPPMADIVDVVPDPRATAVGQVVTVFNEPVQGVGIGAFRLWRDGIPVPLAGLSVQRLDQLRYTVDLSTLTGLPGTYEFRLVAANSGIQDLTGIPLAADAVDSWKMDGHSNAAPVITLAGSALTYTVDDPPLALYAGVAVTDADSADFDGGVLRVAIGAGRRPKDRLAITGTGGVEARNGTILVDGMVVGTSNGVSNGSGILLITLGPASTPANLARILAALVFSSTSEPLAGGNRAIQVVLEDGDGGSSLPVSVQIQVIAPNHVPVTASALIGTYAGIPVAVQLAARDPDDDSLTWEILSPPRLGRLELGEDGCGTYHPDPQAVGDDIIRFCVSDGQAVSPAAELTVRITDGRQERPHAASEPWPVAWVDVVYVYELHVDCSDLGPGPHACSFRLSGSAPTGATLEQTGPTSAVLRWLPQPILDVAEHQGFDIVFTHLGSGRSGIQPLMLLICPVPSGRQ